MRIAALLFLIGCGSTPEQVHIEPPPAVVAETGWSHHGEPFTVSAAMPVADFFANPASFEGKTVRVQGTVSDVCQKAGCWMVIADGSKTMRIRMKDHAFSVDKECSGGKGDIEGVVIAKDVDPEEVAHFASESTPGAAMPESAASRVYEIEATGVSTMRAVN